MIGSVFCTDSFEALRHAGLWLETQMHMLAAEIPRLLATTSDDFPALAEPSAGSRNVVVCSIAVLALTTSHTLPSPPLQFAGNHHALRLPTRGDHGLCCCCRHGMHLPEGY
jgi:hypothetical protein